MGVNLALVDVALLGVEDEFDGVFESEDVVFAVLVDEVDEGGEGGGLAGADGAGDEDEAVVVTGEGHEVFDGQTEFFDGADIGADDPEDDVDAEALFDD